jgi:hypothetical protein
MKRGGNTYRVSVGKSDGKRQLERPREKEREKQKIINRESKCISVTGRGGP